MSPGDWEALQALERRLTHVGATARLIGEHSDLDGDFGEALRGIGATIDECAGRLAEMTNAGIGDVNRAQMAARTA